MSKPKIPLVDLQAQYERIKPEIDAAIAGTICESAFIGGSRVAHFEQKFASYCQARHCVAVSNGSDALFLTLRALGIGPGDEVITAPNTFIATTEAITRCGARPRFVDIVPATKNLDASGIERAITIKTKAVIPVHLYGQPADMDAVLQIARQHGLAVVEDAAQAHGARYRNRRVGSLADAACFSFYPGKNLGAYGDAGAVVTDREEVAAEVRRLRDHGRIDRYEHATEGFNHRCDGMQAAILEVKLRHLDGWNKTRRAHAAHYDRLFAGVETITLPAVLPHVEPVYHLYVIESENRDRVAAALAKQNIATGIHYPIPLHLQPAYRALRIAPGSFPAAERTARRILSLPLYPEMSTESLERIAAEVIKASAQ